MSDHPLPARKVAGLRWPDRWAVGAVVIAALVLLPVASVALIALSPAPGVWSHLWSTTLPRYLGNTLAMMVLVGALAAVAGTVTAWLIVMYRFPGARILEWALLLPLAIPAYVGAYALVDFLEYAGPVQTALRNTFGWQTSRDYWFPEVRTLGAAVIVLAASLYPYVYLLARAAFREQSGAGYEVARALGAGPFARFWRVGLPLARPAIAAGTAIVMMETINDFGTVDHFAVQTLTTGIFTLWLQTSNAPGAAQIACLILMLVIVLVTLEKFSRRQSRVSVAARAGRRPIEPATLTGAASWGALGFCLMPFAVGFILPSGVLLSHAFSVDGWIEPGLARALLHTLTVGGGAALVTVILALLLVYGVRISGSRTALLFLPVTSIGYAAPGAVLGLGLLFPLAAFDHTLADGIEALTGVDIGLLLTGTAGALVIAYSVRFFAIAQGAADAGMGRVPPSLPMAARSLGRTPGGVLSAVYAPLLRASVGSALLLVFVDCVKELPATLLLRPFNYNTLSTRVYEKASLENLEAAAPAALVIVAVGLVATVLLARASRNSAR